MKIHGADFDFIKHGDRSVAKVRAWTEELFKQGGVSEIGLSEEAYIWFLRVVFEAYEKADDELVKRMILVKILHTREVVKAGLEIVREEKNFEWNMDQVGTVCLLHDIARFDQALLGSFSDMETKYNHAVIGAKMVEECDLLDFKELGIDKESVIEAVKHHSEYRYGGKDVYAKLTRDADKLALLRAMPEILKAQIDKYTQEGFSQNVKESYESGNNVRNTDIRTIADLLMAWLAWENDMNFEATKEMYIEEGIKDWMLSEIAKRGVSL